MSLLVDSSTVVLRINDSTLRNTSLDIWATDTKTLHNTTPYLGHCHCNLVNKAAGDDGKKEK